MPEVSLIADKLSTVLDSHRFFALACQARCVPTAKGWIAFLQEWKQCLQNLSTLSLRLSLSLLTWNEKVWIDEVAEPKCVDLLFCSLSLEIMCVYSTSGSEKLPLTFTCRPARLRWNNVDFLLPVNTSWVLGGGKKRHFLSSPYSFSSSLSGHLCLGAKLAPFLH